MKYRHKQKGFLIEAEKLGPDNVDRLANWTQSQIVEEKDAITGSASEGLNLNTPGGKKRVSRGMYVVQHADNFFVAAPLQFESLYEVVT